MTKIIFIETCSDCPYCNWYTYKDPKHECTLIDEAVPDNTYYNTVLNNCPLDDYFSERE